MQFTKAWFCSAFFFATAPIFGQLPNQAIFLTETGDFGTFATQDQSVGIDDPLLHKAYDNFMINSQATISGVGWSGIFAEPIPATPSNIDFVIEIWNDRESRPDVDAGPILSWQLDGGVAGTSSEDVEKLQLEHVSRATLDVFGGGPALEYSAVLPEADFDAGSYWISILASQRFDSESPFVDPEWQWHFGSGAGDGFFALSRESDPPATPLAGLPQGDLDLAFALRGEVTSSCEDPNIRVGDINRNGTVDFADFLILSTNFGQAGDGTSGDTDCNGMIDFTDFLVLSTNFGEAVVSAEAVPEPTAMLPIFLFSVLPIFHYGRSRR